MEGVYLCFCAARCSSNPYFVLRSPFVSTFHGHYVLHPNACDIGWWDWYRAAEGREKLGQQVKMGELQTGFWLPADLDVVSAWGFIIRAYGNLFRPRALYNHFENVPRKSPFKPFYYPKQGKHHEPFAYDVWQFNDKFFKMATSRKNIEKLLIMALTPLFYTWTSIVDCVQFYTPVCFCTVRSFVI